MSPLLRFGCRIMVHTPATLQTNLSNNAQIHYYVGSVPFHKAGIMLYNPKTKQTIILRSFTQLESFHPYLFSFQQSTLKIFIRPLFLPFPQIFPLRQNIYQKQKLQRPYMKFLTYSVPSLSPTSFSRPYCYSS